MVYSLSEPPLFHYYDQVRPIVLGLQRAYSSEFWLIDDWDVHGLSVLMSALTERPSLTRNLLSMRVYFRTAFISHLQEVYHEQAGFS